MTADHGETPVPGRQPSGGDAQGPSRFEIVLRGYDRRQVDDHIANLERTITRQRADLEQARGPAGWPPPGTNGIHPRSDERSQAGAAALFNPGTGSRPGPAPRPEAGSGGGLNPEMISSFTARLQSILHAAEEEAEEVRSNARNYAHAEEQASGARLEELERRRQAVLAELGRVRNHLDGLLSHSDSDSLGERTAVASAPTTPPAPEQPDARPEPSAARPAEARPDHARETAPAYPGQARPTSAQPQHRTPPSQLPTRMPPTSSPTPNRPSPGSAVPPGGPANPGGPGQPGGAVPAQPKPRPTPSPRPRTAPPSSGVPGADAGAGRGPAEQQGGRNGSAGRDNGTPGRGNDSDGGRSTFGSGAR